MIWGITLILLSIIAVPSLLLSKKPNANELLEKVEPYQGFIGIVCCFLGVWGIIMAFLNLSWLSATPIWWATFLAGNSISALLGFMLGSGLINRLFLSRTEFAKAKTDELRARLAPQQGRLGIVGMVLGIWMIVASFVFTAA